MASTAQLAGSALANSALATRPGGFRFQGMMTEKKVVDIGNGNFGINSVGTITAINLIQTGSSYYQRVGRKINMTSVEIRGSIFSAGATPTAETARLMILYDKQPNGAFPAIGDILLDQPAGTTNLQASINIANKSRFVFIRDQFFTIDPGVGQEYILKLYAKGRWETEYGSNAGNIGDIKTGALYMLLFYTRYGTAVPALSLFHSRIRYFD